MDQVKGEVWSAYDEACVQSCQPRAVDTVEADTFEVSVVQNF
jgi:hypothetical protein